MSIEVGIWIMGVILSNMEELENEGKSTLSNFIKSSSVRICTSMTTLINRLYVMTRFVKTTLYNLYHAYHTQLITCKLDKCINVTDLIV